MGPQAALTSIPIGLGQTAAYIVRPLATTRQLVHYVLCLCTLYMKWCPGWVDLGKNLGLLVLGPVTTGMGNHLHSAGQ